VSCSDFSHMSFSEAAVHLYALTTVVYFVWRHIANEVHRVRPGRTRAPMPDRSVYTWPRWDSQQQVEPPTRHIP
jgi:hypothetical protein